MQTCDQGNCSLECNNVDVCVQKCNNDNGECTLNCNGENCVQTCDGGKCSLECNGKQCSQTCREGTCSLDCNGKECNQTCYRDCNLECHGESCNQDCSYVQGSCQFQCPNVSDANKRNQNCPAYKKRWCTKNLFATTKAPTSFSEHSHSCTGE